MSHVELREVVVGDVVFVAPTEWNISRLGNLIKVISPDEDMGVIMLLDSANIDDLLKELPGPKVIHGNVVKWNNHVGKFGVEVIGWLQFSWLYYTKGDLSQVEGILKTVVKTLRRKFSSPSVTSTASMTPIVPTFKLPPQQWLISPTNSLIALMMLAHQRFINNLIFWDIMSEMQHHRELFRMFRDTANYISRLRMKEWESIVKEWEESE